MLRAFYKVNIVPDFTWILLVPLCIQKLERKYGNSETNIEYNTILYKVEINKLIGIARSAIIFCSKHKIFTVVT